MNKLIPIDDKIIIKPIKKEVSEGGVYMPNIDDEEGRIGEVVAVGPGLPRLHGNLNDYTLTAQRYLRTDMFIEVGDTVFYPSFKGGKIEYEDEEYYIFRETEILAVIKKDDE